MFWHSCLKADQKVILLIRAFTRYVSEVPPKYISFVYIILTLRTTILWNLHFVNLILICRSLVASTSTLPFFCDESLTTWSSFSLRPKPINAMLFSSHVLFMFKRLQKSRKNRAYEQYDFWSVLRQPCQIKTYRVNRPLSKFSCTRRLFSFYESIIHRTQIEMYYFLYANKKKTFITLT